MSTFRTVNCEKHGDYQATVTEAGSGRFMKEFVTPCPKCVEDLKINNLKEIENHRNHLVKNAVDLIMIPKRYQNIPIYDIKPMNEDQRKIIFRCKSYIEKYNKLKEIGTSLVFTGKPGTGKTMIALSMINPIISKSIDCEMDKYKKAVELGGFHGNELLGFHDEEPIFKYINTYDLFLEIKSTYNKNSLKTEGDVLYEYTSPEILIIDEVGAQSGSDYETTTMFRIINSRYENMKPTFLISNLSEDDLSKYIGERTIDRFYENHGAVFVFDWESHRRI